MTDKPMPFHIIGDPDTIIGYRLAGVTGSAVESVDEALAAFEHAIEHGAHDVLMLTEPVEQMIPDSVTEHRLRCVPPYIVVVRDVYATQVRRNTLEQLVREAVGIRIVKDE